MSYQTEILENGSKRTVYTGKNTIGLLNAQYNGSSNVIAGIYTINMMYNYTFGISLKNFNKYTSIKTVKLRVYTGSNASNKTVFVRKTDGYSSSNGVSTATFLYNSAGYLEADVTKLVFDDISNTIYLSMRAKETVTIYSDDAPVGFRPELIVEYIDTDQGLLNQLYVEEIAGETDKFKVNVRNGQPFLSRNLIKLAGTVMPLNLSLEYNGIDSNLVNFEGMPKGWKFNYNQKVFYSSGDYIYIDSVGIKHRFVLAVNSTNVFYDIAGTGFVLNVLEGGYIITDCKNKFLHFDANGLLIKIEQLVDGVSLSTVLSYDESSQLVSILDGMNRTFDISYYDSYIIVSGLGINNVRIMKDQSNFLEEVIDFNNYHSNYSFDMTGLILTVNSSRGESLKLEYDDLKRVSTITKYGATENYKLYEESFEYKPSVTFVTNQQGVCYEYSFDDCGENISVSESGSSGNGTIASIEKKNFETVKKIVKKEIFLGFTDVQVVSSTEDELSHELTLDYLKSQGDVIIRPDDKYVLSFKYKIAGSPLNGGSFEGKIVVKQGSMELGSLQLDANTYYYKNGTMILNVSDNTIPEIILKYKGLGEVLNISDVRIYKYESEVERVCLNYDTDSEYQVTLMDQTWHQINDNNFNGFIVNGVQYGKMYKEDLLENIENQSIENSNHYTWYNKKRRLVISDSVSLVLGDSQVDLSSIKVAVVNELSDRTVGGYSVYNVDGCFRKDYVITLIDDEEFILSREYDENFLLTRSLNHKGIEKTNTYNSDGNILSTALKHKNGSCAIKTEFIYDGKYLLNDITYLNGNEVINSYDYNRNTGDLIMKTNYLGVDTYYDYDQFNRFNKLSLFANGIENYNEILYSNDLVSGFKDSSGNISWTYDQYNLIDKYYLSGKLFLQITTDINNTGFTRVLKSEYDHIYLLSELYDVYGRLISLTESIDGSNYSSVKQYLYSDKFVDEIDEIYDPEDEVLLSTSASKLRKTLDLLIDNTTRFYYNEDENVETITNTCNDYYPSRVEFNYDSFKRLSQKQVETASGDIMTTSISYENNYDSEVESILTEYNFVCEVSNDSLEITTLDFISCNIENIKDELNRISDKNYTFNESIERNVSYEYLTTDDKSTYLISREIHNEDELYYEYDLSGNIISITDENNELLVSYEYDELGRLIRENNVELNKTYLWTYDGNGNVTSKKETSYTTDAVNCIPLIFEYSNTTKDQLIKFGDQLVNTNQGVVITAIGDTQFEWFRRNKLKKVSFANGKYINFDYNADGIRTSKEYYDGTKTYTHKYLLDEEKILQERITCDDITNTLHYLYCGMEIVGFVYNQDKYFFKKNFRNDIIAIYDSNDCVVAKYVYDAWGNHKVYDSTGIENTDSSFIGNINPFRYRGYYYDKEMDLYYCLSRYYNPKLYRWMCLDDVKYMDEKLINGLNLYAYCNNNPVKLIDRYGTYPTVVNYSDEKNLTQDIPPCRLPYWTPNYLEEILKILFISTSSPSARDSDQQGIRVPFDLGELGRNFDSHDRAVYLDYIKNNSHAMSGKLDTDISYGALSRPITFEEDNFNFWDDIDLFD